MEDRETYKASKICKNCGTMATDCVIRKGVSAKDFFAQKECGNCGCWMG